MTTSGAGAIRLSPHHRLHYVWIGVRTRARFKRHAASSDLQIQKMTVANSASDRRIAPRFEIVAQASVTSGGHVHVLPVRNISASGAFLEARPREHGDLVPGVEVEVSLSATVPAVAEDDVIAIDEVINIECRGRVARVQFRTPSSPSGFGITLAPKSAEDQERLEDLLSRLIALPANQRPISLG